MENAGLNVVASFAQQSRFELDRNGNGGNGLVVSLLTLYSDDASLNPAEVYIFYVKMLFEMNQNKQKEAGICPFQNRYKTQ